MEPLASRRITYNGRLFHKFVTRPDIDAPVFNISGIYGPNIETEGCWFVAPHGKLDAGRPGPQWVGPHIYDNDGELVWSGVPMFRGWNTFDFHPSLLRVDSQSVCSLVSVHEQRGFILDNSYLVHKTVPFRPESESSMHWHDFNVFNDTTPITPLALGQFSVLSNSYPAFKRQWEGSPATQPDIHAAAVYLGSNNSSEVTTVIHVSWNGDTQTKKWKFYGIDSEGNTYPLGFADRRGFETRFEYGGFVRRVFVEALDGLDIHDNYIAESKVAITASPELVGEGRWSGLPSRLKGEYKGGHVASVSATWEPSLKAWKTFAAGLLGIVGFGLIALSCMQHYQKDESVRFGQEQQPQSAPISLEKN